MKELLKLGIAEEIPADYRLQKGDIVRRVSAAKDLQACFMMYDGEESPVVINVVDMNAGEFTAEAGILKITKNDRFYRYLRTFANCSKTREAEEILKNWQLYKKNPELQKSMMAFMKLTFAPMQIIDFQKNSALKFLFVPIQQKFKIGSGQEKTNWPKVRKEKFTKFLTELKDGEHLTYVAFIPPSNSHSPLFYTVGTKPHETTHEILKSEPFIFEPTHGGHIKAQQDERGITKFLVDAGSSYLGRGASTSIIKAEDVVKALKRIYPDFVFVALAGRDAFGTGQSY